MTTPQLILLGCSLTLLVTGLLGAAVALRRARVRDASLRAELGAELVRSRHEVADLADEVRRLSTEVEQARRAAVEARAESRARAAEREYVITSLAAGGDGALPGAVPLPRPPASQVLEEQVVRALAEHQGRSPLRARAVDAGIRVLATGHGVRQALRAENRDRAAAEAHVARRRSRRTRKQELREARRMVRAVRRAQAAQPTQADAPVGGMRGSAA